MYKIISETGTLTHGAAPIKSVMLDIMGCTVGLTRLEELFRFVPEVNKVVIGTTVISSIQELTREEFEEVLLDNSVGTVCAYDISEWVQSKSPVDLAMEMLCFVRYIARRNTPSNLLCAEVDRKLADYISTNRKTPSKDVAVQHAMMVKISRGLDVCRSIMSRTVIPASMIEKVDIISQALDLLVYKPSQYDTRRFFNNVLITYFIASHGENIARMIRGTNGKALPGLPHKFLRLELISMILDTVRNDIETVEAENIVTAAVARMSAVPVVAVDAPMENVEGQEEQEEEEAIVELAYKYDEMGDPISQCDDPEYIYYKEFLATRDIIFA
jgi:hypothetical protein